MNQSGFKLIAIRPLEGCAPKFLKNLNVQEYYYFYKNYRITSFGKDEEQIRLTGELPPDIYSRPGNPTISISAVVGKNGAGKSSLIELLYAGLYNIANKYRFIDKKDDEGNLYQYNQDLRMEFFYLLEGVFFKVTFNDFLVWHTTFNENGVGYASQEKFKSRKRLSMFFYSVVINYSLYALNASETGHWINSIFHKNDAYQTPIVLNPYRKNGNIDINSENYLVRSRLLVNIFGSQDGLFNFKNNKRIVKKIIFTLDTSKFRRNKRTKRIIFPETNDLKRRIFPVLWDVFFNDSGFEPTVNHLNKFATEYIILKLKKIALRYPQYKIFGHFYTSKNALKRDEVRRYLEELRNDDSHITFKLKQAINFLRFENYRKDMEKFEEDVSAISAGIKAIRKDHPTIPVIELLPPSFLSFDMEFESEDDRFDRLSSGEKQKIYTLSSLIYHLRNLNSVTDRMYAPQKGERKVRLVKYEHLNVIFDEIELYYHPDLQRRFIKDLLEAINGAKLQTIKSINLVFITHSPFILSDIPDENTLYLDVRDRRSFQIKSASQTFGGNIHELLANSFFLENEGYMGEYAKEIITSAINYLIKAGNERRAGRKPKISKQWNVSKIRSLIDMVGEPLIKRSLNELYAEAFLIEESEIDAEIARLQQWKAERRTRSL